MANTKIIIDSLRSSFQSKILKSFDFRKKLLGRLFDFIAENEEILCEALHADLGKSKLEAMSAEILLVKGEISKHLQNMEKWLAPEKVSRTLLTATDSHYIRKDPYGVVLILGAWNVPVSLLMFPLIGAIAAGNCVLLKPSEVASHVERVVAEHLPRYTDERVVQIFTGGPAETKALLDNEQFDYVFFTGSGHIGKLIAQQCVAKSTPYTLELGGKAPVYLDSNVDVDMAAKRIGWGKACNAGQLCVAPDYILCHADVKDAFIERVKARCAEWYGGNGGAEWMQSKDYGRIINDRNYQRLTNILSETNGKILYGGATDAETRFIQMTIIELSAEQAETDSTMREEIFGPLLPLICVNSVEEAVQFVNAKPERTKPLAAYIFTRDSRKIEFMEENVQSGSFMSNEVTIHFGFYNHPFGGVGQSGIGKYHGIHSINTFTHQRGVVHKDTMELFNNQMRYPPYSDAKLKKMKWVIGGSKPSDSSNCCIICGCFDRKKKKKLSPEKYDVIDKRRDIELDETNPSTSAAIN